jgi:hypothetical protein
MGPVLLISLWFPDDLVILNIGTTTAIDGLLQPLLNHQGE